MNELPSTVSPFRTVGPFTQHTLPAGLLKRHRTKAGVWGLLQVTSGRVHYIVAETDHESTLVLDESTPGVIIPEKTHHLTVVGPVTCQITFYKECTS
ncbi:MAG: DUF1971 domain-containing protein [Pseudomonadales bacterium]|nr:DUF1971 domain-containing protein [Pseudomonadales bacterium]MBL6813744.1 DUF1971 domain-containing protein [Pseudomonadales bacterium]